MTVDFNDDSEAINYLKSFGFIMTRNYYWIKPDGVEITSNQWRALNYLFDEWDFGGVVSKADCKLEWNYIGKH